MKFNKDFLLLISNAIVREGVFAFLFFTLPRKFFSDIKDILFKLVVLQKKSREERFTWIYRHNIWRNSESRSGSGSTLEYTKNIRESLKLLIQDYSLHSILDAPCGDFNWMKVFLDEVNIKYIGADIVKPMIDLLNDRYSSPLTSFCALDITSDPLPYADLMICRDCLFHLSEADIKLVLVNFLKSKIPYLLTTTHITDSGFLNKDVVTGDFRLINLFFEPYNFPADPLVRIVDFKEPEYQREMCLWSHEQIKRTLKASYGEDSFK